MLKQLRCLELTSFGVVEFGVRQLVQLLTSPDCKLEKLELENSNNIVVEDFGEVLRVLGSQPSSLRELCLIGFDGEIQSQFSRGEDSGLTAFIDNLRFNTSLYSLKLQNCDINDDMLVMLCEALGSSILEELDLSDNSAIHLQGAREIGSLLIFNLTIKRLQLSGCYNIQDAGLEMICVHLFSNQSLEALDISRMHLTDCGSSVAAMLTVNKTLKELNLANNSIGFFSVSPILNALIEDNSTLTCLNLNYCALGPYDYSALVKLLGNRERHFKTLALGQNQLTEQVISSFALALETTQVDDLDLSEVNDDGQVSLGEIFRSIAHNESMRRLDISKNILSPEDVEQCRFMMSMNKSLIWLNLNSTNMGNEGVSKVCQALKSNGTITHLQMRNVGLTGLSASQVSSLFVSTSNLKALDISENLLGDQHLLTVADALRFNRSMLWLNVLQVWELETFPLVHDVCDSLCENTSLLGMRIFSSPYHQEQVDDIMASNKRKFMQDVKLAVLQFVEKRDSLHRMFEGHVLSIMAEMQTTTINQWPF